VEASREGPREGPIILVFLVLTLAASAFVLHRAEANTVKDPRQKAARGEITGLTELSLVREENLRRALKLVDQSKWPLVSNIRVAPDRINLSVRDKDGYRRYVTIDPSLKLTTSDAGVGEDYAIHTESINAGAPERMLKLVAAKTGLTPAAMDYAATSFSENSKATWFMGMKRGPARVRQWIAEADGSDIRRPGEPSTAQKRAAEENKRHIERQIRHTRLMIKKRIACVNKAHDADAVSRCLEKYQP
jgi:hypothetical protein